MKTLRFIGIVLVAMVLGAGVCACSDDDDELSSVSIKTENTVTMETAGTLRQSLILDGKLWSITSLKITGPINGDDIICLRQMLRCTDEDESLWGVLTVLDLSDASIVEGGDSYYRSYSTSNDEIGNYMFYNCIGLERIALPKSVTKIRAHAFVDCYGLTAITILESVTTIGLEAFYWCDGLTEVTIGSGVTSIGSYAFWGCRAMTKFSVAKSNEYYCTQDRVLFTKDMTELIQFPAASSVTSYSIPKNVTTIGGGAFYYCEGLTSVTIGNDVTKIGDYAFEECEGLTSVTIGNCVTKIGEGAFRSCMGLTSVTIPESVTKIGDATFAYCSGLTEVTIGNGVTSIGYSAFRSCTSLTRVTIGNSVTSIYSGAFYECTGLKSVTSLNPQPPKFLSGSAFSSSITSTCVLYVPKGSKEAYSTASTWSDFKHIEEI